jgi:hypothetical protein
MHRPIKQQKSHFRCEGLTDVSATFQRDLIMTNNAGRYITAFVTLYIAVVADIVTVRNCDYSLF